MNRDKFRDSHEQLAIHKDRLSKTQRQDFGDPQNETARKQERDCREQYIVILSPAMPLVKQQSKVDWIQYGDNCTIYCFAKVKGRKLALYIYSIRDERGEVSKVLQKLQNHIRIF